MDNFGDISLGEYARGITVTQMQYSDGSQYGGHLMRMATTDNMGSFPSDHYVRITRYGHDLCVAEENLDTPYMCQINATSNFEYTVVMPALTPSIIAEGQDRVHIRIEFRNRNHRRPTIITSSSSLNYWGDVELTPQIVSISSSDFIFGDTLTVTLRDPLIQGCAQSHILIGELDCPITSCSSDANGAQLSCSVPAQPAGYYRIRANFDRMGDAGYADPWLEHIVMRFEVNGISPLIGSFGGGTPVTITGNGFSHEIFDGSLCSQPLEDCQFTPDGTVAHCHTPNIGSHQTCSFEFGGLSGTVRDGFDFQFDSGFTPIIDAINPKMGGSMGGTVVTISGTNFSPGNQNVTIGSSACEIQSETSDEIVCQTGAHPTSTKHRVVISVGGQGDAAAPDIEGEFWYVDRWSSVFTWGCNDTNVACPNKPVDLDIAVIPKGTTVEL